MKSKKMGRPTDSLKSTQIAIRFDAETLKVLDEYCNQKKISRAEGIRQSVKKLKTNKE